MCISVSQCLQGEQSVMNKEKDKGVLRLDVQMFGDFRIKNEDGVLTSENIRSEMLTRLLTYIVCHRKKSLTVQEFIEVLWPEDESDNPAGALKNLMYRLRNLLKKTWGAYDFILTGRGTYQWNPDIVLNVDTEKFENYCKNICSDGNAEEEIQKGKEAIGLYKGSFLPELASEYWVISMSTYYNTLFLSEVKKLAALMEQEKDYAELEQLCIRELGFEPLDEEIHCYLMRALIAENKQEAADQHYKKTVKYFYDTLGVRPSEEMQQIYEEMQKRQHEHESNIDIIQEELREKSLPTGAFLCEYGVFRKIYALESRSSSRMGIPIHLTLMSVHLELRAMEKQIDCKGALNEAMDKLEKTLVRGLRNSDIVCRYSVNQFLIMLPACQYEDAKMVVNRLKDRFYQLEKGRRAILQYSIDEIGVV